MRARGIVVAAVLAFCVALLAAAPARAASSQPPKKIDFNRDIRPILSDNCYFCHGPDKNRRKADLRLDTKDGLFGEKDDTFPVVPGKPDDSVLFMRITSDDPDYRMPHKDSNKHLTPEQIATIKRWIEEGAQWKGHWSYLPPVKAPLPQVEIDKFTRNDIDRYVGEAYQEHQLSPAPEADRVTLIRRLSFDLTGLPPTPAEVDEFVNDKEANAYEKLVNRLMASPHFGERMAVSWMDLVRYGDTIGFHSDNPREVWPWRDWCINAFNNNEPFDQFTIEQIAGDLLPNPTREQKVASGYNRLLLTTGEGGAQAKEYIAKYGADRVRNVSTVWLGSTMGCCQCHDHKFDPFSTKDFYSLQAFFADIQEPAISLPSPELLLPDAEQEEELKRLDETIAAAKAKLNQTTPEIAAAELKYETKAREALKDPVTWTPLTVIEARSAGGAVMTIGEDKQHVLVSGNAPDKDTYTVRATTKAKKITALRVEAVPHKRLPAGGPGRAANGNFVLTEIDLAAEKGVAPTTQPVALQNASASFEQTLFAEASPYRRYSAAGAIDGDKYGDKFGWAILDRTNQPNYAVFETAFDVGGGDEVQLAVTMKFNLGDHHALGHFRLSVTDSPRPVRAIPDSGIPPEIVKLLKLDPAKLTAEQKEKLAAHYRTVAPELEPVRQELAQLTQQRADMTGPAVMTKYNQNKPRTIPRTLISVTGTPRETRILARGNWQDDSGEVVTPHVPHFLRQLDVPKDQRATRLDLARWLVARDNPLTARVFVNRLWKMFYGQGIAKPLDDMGSQGDWPTHPELLDYLAVEFMDSGWDVKHMVKLMVESGTYRQDSIGSKETREADPYNKWVARQGSFRLDAEFVRDNALAVSGLLSPRMFGPSVKPYQPAGYWEFLNFPKRTYDQDHGDKLYRRGLYTWWQRTFLNPSLLNFDAPSHEECTAERTRSNTPQQALTLLNDVTYVEAARVFAARIMKECPGDATARVKWAYHTALSREPTPAELPVLLALYDKHQKRYASDKAAAEKLVTMGEAPPAKDLDECELAAWTSVARAILNLHETITRS